jgi:hypothetical protein
MIDGTYRRRQDRSQSGMYKISSPVMHDRAGARRFTLWCLAAALLVTALNVSSPRMHVNFYDGRFFCVAAQMFLEGESPYDLERFRARLHDIAQQYPDSAAELHAEIDWYAYPPASLIVFAPLGLLDYPLARQLFSLLNVLLMPLAAWMIVVFFDGANVARQKALTVAALMVGLLHFSFPVTVLIGQCDIVILVALAGTLLALQRRSVLVAAACAAVALIKPQLTLLPILAIIVRERAWRDGVTLLGAVALTNLLAVLFIYHPGLPREMLDAVIYNRRHVFNQATGSYGGLFLGARSPAFAMANLLLIPAAVVAVLLAAWKRDRYPQHTALVAAILLTLYAMPLHHYDFVVLLAALLGCLTINVRLAVPLILLAIGVERESFTQSLLAKVPDALSLTYQIALALGIDRDSVSQAMVARNPGVPWLTHQILHATYVLFAFLAVEGYVFFRYWRSSQSPPSAPGSATASPAGVVHTESPWAAQRSTKARGSAQPSE